MLRKTVLSLESPTGAFIAPLRCANANLFNKVQEKLAKNKKAPARHKAEESYLLTTKLYCGKCGALMFGESGVSHTGKMYTYYKCAAAKKKKTCDKKAVRKQWLEDLVVNETMKLVEDDASMNAIIAKVMELQNQESTDLPIYEKQLKETETGITNMLNAIQMGILTSSTKERLEALEDQRKELQARIAEERLAKPKMKEEFVRFWLLRFRKLDMTQPEQRQALVDTFINAIYLYDDKVLITFNYKEGTETVAFGEAVKAEKSSDMSARGAPDIECQIVRFDALFCYADPEKSGPARSMHGFCIEVFLELLPQFYTRGLLDMGVGVHQHICRIPCRLSFDFQRAVRGGFAQDIEAAVRECWLLLCYTGVKNTQEAFCYGTMDQRWSARGSAGHPLVFTGGTV